MTSEPIVLLFHEYYALKIFTSLVYVHFKFCHGGLVHTARQAEKKSDSKAYKRIAHELLRFKWISSECVVAADAVNGAANGKNVQAS